MPTLKPPLKLTKLVTDWIKRDPLLSKHIWFNRRDLQDPGIFLAGCCKRNQVQYAIGFISNVKAVECATWSWTEVPNHDNPKKVHPGNRQPNIIHHPEDPKFFENLKRGLIIAHNSLRSASGCRALKVPKA